MMGERLSFSRLFGLRLLPAGVCGGGAKVFMLTEVAPMRRRAYSSAMILSAMRSESAEMVSDGFTPSAVGIIDASAIYKPS